MLERWGKGLLIAGAVLIAVGVVLWGLSRLGWERLPGDIVWKGRGGVTVFIPLGLSLLLSVILTILLNLMLRRR